MNPRIKILRVGVASCGIAAGAEAVQSKHKECAGNVPVVGVGCLGSCYAEPMVEAVLDDGSGILYGNVTPEDVPGILELTDAKRFAPPPQRAAKQEQREQRAAGLPRRQRRRKECRSPPTAGLRPAAGANGK